MIFPALNISAMNMFLAFVAVIIILPLNNIILKETEMLLRGYNI